MIETIITAGLTALTKLLLDYIQQRRDNQNTIDLGKASEATAVSKGTADAERRATQAGNDAPDVGGVIDDMDGGKF